uniref:Cupin type-1 domain-containing protein n=1 Tax=Tetradesmus obliquus TaxID=3088 RepID=A0A383W9E2_TETOB|eukprot:jgi/Sobl393_1/16840/SZX74061.1
MKLNRLPVAHAVAAAMTLLLLVHAAVADKYTEAFSKVPWQEFPGGRFKASTNATLSASTIAGALFQLKPGGLRELHWHDVAEWAVVIDGACMGTATDESKLHPSDTWNFTAGDLWYFPANVPHSIVGLGPSGCTYITGYNAPDFNELTSFSASSWLATVPLATLAQALGISTAAAQRILDGNAGGKPSFIPQGSLRQMLAQAPSLPVQFPKLIHRYPLLQNTHEVVNADGSYVNMADVTRFPVATDMSGAIVRIAPGGMRQLHWHLNFDEWQFVINGTLEVGVFTEPGQSAGGVLQPGDLGFAPRGSGHYLRNIGQQMAHVVLIFNAGLFTNVDVGNFLGTVPPAYVAASLNISDAAAREIDYSLGGFAPAQLPPSQ